MTQEEYEDVYNRYAHIEFELQNVNNTTFNLSIPYKENGTQKYLRANGTATIGTNVTLTDVMLNFWISSGNTVNAQNVKLMLVEGTTAPSRYSPYIANPIELCKIGNYVDSIKKSSGKNKLDSSLIDNKSSNGVTSTVTNGIINLSGTATATADIYFYGDNSNYVDISDIGLEAGNYKVTGCIGGSGTTYMLYIVQNRSGSLYYYQTYSASDTNITLQTGDKLRIFLRVINGTNVTGKSFYVMIRKNTENASPEPYGVGTWYIEKNIKKFSKEKMNLLKNRE